MKKEHVLPFWKFAFEKYKLRTGSIFMGALVGGLFLSYLVDDNSCMEPFFNTYFFLLGISHYISSILEAMETYSSEVAAFDGEISKLEEYIANIILVLKHINKLLQYPLVVGLGYFAIKFRIEDSQGILFKEKDHSYKLCVEKNRHVNDTALNAVINEAKDNCKFCMRSQVELAEITFAFQVIYGILILISWFCMWYLDDEDDEKERREQVEWQEAEAKLKGTFLGNIKEIAITIGMEPFFDENISGTMLAISLAVPPSACNMELVYFFLYAGIMQVFNEMLSDLKGRINDMAGEDQIINKTEHYILEALKMLNFPLFMAEFTVFILISMVYFTDLGRVNFKNEKDPYYCKESMWHLTNAIFWLYSILFVFRCCVIAGSLMSGTPTDNTLKSDEPVEGTAKEDA